MMKARSMSMLLFIGCISIVLLGTGPAFGWGKKELETEAIATKFARQVIKGGYGIVTTNELKEWQDNGKKMIIVDTMPYEDSYKKNHIPGAVQILFPKAEQNELDGKTRNEYMQLLGPDKDIPVVVYCGFTKCGRSNNGALWAVKLGYKDVYRCPGGIKGWLEAEYPVSKVE